MAIAVTKRQSAAASKMSLRELLDRYMSAVEVSRRYAESLRRTVKKLEGSGLSRICQLAPDEVNSFLSSLRLSATTKHNIRRELLTLWRFACECGLTDVYPLRIRKIRPTYATPRAWSREELARLLKTATRDETAVGGRSGLRVCDLLPAWVGVAYDSGLRFGDVLGSRTADIRNGCICFTAGKTGKAGVRPLSPSTNAAVRRLAALSPDGTLFRWALTRRRAFLVWRAFLDRHRFHGSSKWLRRSCATFVEQAQPGAASRYLQHSNQMLATRHYIDQSMCAVPIGPPPIR